MPYLQQMHMFYIFLGGGLGSLARYLLGKFIAERLPGYFPFATLGVNVVACLGLGLFLAWSESQPQPSVQLRLFIAVGFFGGFSTFSTFSYETLYLLRDGRPMAALGYICLSVALCLAATAGGYFSARF